jgi:hypothetical protein
MSKIVDPDDLVIGTNLTVDTSTLEITLTVAGSLVAKDGVTMQALYSKLVELWTTATYNKYPFPMYTIDVRSGQFQVGTDGATPNGWTFDSDDTREMIRDAGWAEFAANGDLQREYVGIVALASGFPSGTQFYFQRASGGSAIDFAFDDAPNQGVQVYGDASNGNFDTRTYFRIFCRAEGYTYDQAVLGDVGETATGPYKLQLPISVNTDIRVQDIDANVAANAPYTGIDVEYFGTDQSEAVGGSSYPFRRIVDGNGASLEDIYTKLQYLLRQTGDIDTGAGTVAGKTADQLAYFVGDTLYTTLGVFIDNIDANDLNRVVFLDQNGVERSFPFVAAGTLTFNAPLQGAGGYYRMYFTALPGASDDWGESGAVTVEDGSAADIAGSISGGSVGFTFDYDANVQGGRTAGTDAAVTVVAGRPNSAKPVVATGTITRSKGITIALVAEQDRGYANP